MMSFGTSSAPQVQGPGIHGHHRIPRRSSGPPATLRLRGKCQVRKRPNGWETNKTAAWQNNTNTDERKLNRMKKVDYTKPSSPILPKQT